MKRLNYEVSDDAHIKIRLMAAARQVSQKELIETMINESYIKMVQDNPGLIPGKEVKHQT